MAAYMIPETPKEYDPRSKEGMIFDALSKLGNDYFVYHSVSVARVEDTCHELRQTDFIVFNPSKGVLCIEAKAGDIAYKNGKWVYLQTTGNDIPLTHDGPFNQVSTYTSLLIKKIRDRYPEAVSNCRFIYGVWFPSLTEDGCRKINFPPEADARLVLTKDDLNDPTKKIESLFELNPFGTTVVTRKEKCGVIASALAPEFVISLGTLRRDANNSLFVRLLNQQYAVLEYLREQKTAVINGLAGTGKTLVAVEKARRCAEKKEKVLFLCFTVFLCEDLKNRHIIEGVDFLTLSQYTRHVCGDFDPYQADYYYEKAAMCLLDKSADFPYDHIIIDEGQDLCLSDRLIDFAEILKEIVERKGGTMYIFYDKNQAVLQNYNRIHDGGKLPDIINDADCKITLYRNCRNTERIAKTSLTPFFDVEKSTSIKPIMMEPVSSGRDCYLYNVADSKGIKEVVDSVINETLAGGEYCNEDIVILTVGINERSSAIFSDVEDRNGKLFYKNCWFTTSKKFKGLEAPVIIIIDVDRNTFLDQNEEEKSKYYVAASRAKMLLRVVSRLSDDDCAEILQKNFNSSRGMRPLIKLAGRLQLVAK